MKFTDYKAYGIMWTHLWKKPEP